MSNATTSAAWRGEAVTPGSYDDVVHVVRCVRRARQRVVEFAWRLTADQLRHLRAGITAWSSSVVGRYKTFDARIVGAINAALGEPDAGFAIREPRNGAIDCTITCTPVGEVFLLAGYAPFDLVFAYALTGADGGSTGAHLDEATRTALADGVRALGWDVERMREPRLLPARNALFGFPLAHGADDIPRSGEPPVEVPVDFRGPFSTQGVSGAPQLFDEPIAQRRGIYLWSYAVDGVAHVAYVGQTRRSFAARIEEHLSALLSGRYEIPDIDATLRGEPKARWHPDGNPAVRWRKFLGDHARLATAIEGVLDALRFHVAPIDGDEHLYNRIEGALGRYFRAEAPVSDRRLFDARIRVPAAVPGDRPLRLLLSSDTKIAGLPDELRT